MKLFQKISSAVTACALTVSMTAGSSMALLSSVKAADQSAIDIVNAMGMGWNLGNTFDCHSTRGWTTDTETAWGNPTTTQDMISAIKASGFDSVRIPITWYENLADTSTYDIDDAYLARIKEVVDYAYANDMYVIINMHWDWISDGSLWLNQGINALPQYQTMWTEIANYFKDYDNHLVFESMNEVTFEYDVLNNFNQSFVDLVRKSGGNNENRLLLLAGKNDDLAQTCTDSYVVPDDDMVAVSIHYYTPSTFCVANIDSTWGHAETWGTESEIQDLYNNFNKMKATFVDKGIPVIVGEYGVLTQEKDQKNKDDVIKYLKTVASTALAIDGISAYLWDAGNAGDMQFFDRKNLTWFSSDIQNVYKDLKANGSNLSFNYNSTKEVTIPLASYKDENGYTVNIAGYGANGEKLEKVILNGKLTGSEEAGYGIGFSATRGGQSGQWTSETASLTADGTGTAVFDGIFSSETGDEAYEFEFNYLQIQNWWGGTADLESITLVFDKEITTVTVEEGVVKPPTPTEPETTAPTEPTGDTTEPATSEASILYGDANLDGNVDILDIIAMNKNILGQKIMTKQELLNSDLNKNGMVEPEESLAVMKYIVKLITAEELANF
ncbi:MAG: cellulase family glycosylhydrolase [Ruminococcus sp.]|nr:cellulase family glycosylhydrolase [Ruminococcus sp.]